MNKMNRLSLGCALVATVAGLLGGALAEQTAIDSRPAAPAAAKSVKEMQAEFLKLKFGMFIPYSLEAFKGVPWVAGYHSPADFNPGGKVDTDAWQVAELLEKYPDVFYIWNDGLDPKIMPADDALAFIRRLRVDLLASSNGWDWGEKGTPFADIAVKEMRQFPVLAEIGNTHGLSLGRGESPALRAGDNGREK